MRACIAPRDLAVTIFETADQIILTESVSHKAQAAARWRGPERRTGERTDVFGTLSRSPENVNEALSLEAINEMTRKTILVHPSSGAMDVRVRETMAALTPVTFVTCSDLAECQEGDVVITLSHKDDALLGLRARKVRCFHVANGNRNGDAVEVGGESIQFTGSRVLDQRLRSRLLAHKPLPGYSGIKIERGDEVLAYCSDKPVWVVRNQGDFLMHAVSVPLPSLTDNETSFDFLWRDEFFRLLPLLHFLREVTADSGWKKPPLRACLMLDDPNLHWPTYGFLPYEKLLEQAKSHRFHVAFAMVPLDAWLANATAVKLFRNHPQQFSLLVHGNDHSKHELSQKRSGEDYLRLAAQSLRRIDRLEKATGLHVSRVMAPPHGACTRECLAALLAAGFEGVCAPAKLLREFNPDVFHYSSFGLELAEALPGNAPVIPRFRLDSSCEGAIVISAFLDRPIIPVGHHYSAANGLELLVHTAQIINSLGEVSWENPEMMLRANFRSFQDHGTLWIEPYSCRIQFTVPPGINYVGLCRPGTGISNGESEFAFVSKRGTDLRTIASVTPEPLAVMVGDRIELVSVDLGKVDFRRVEKPRFSVSLRAFPRRLLCELRDRCMPSIPRDLIPKKWMRG